MIKIAENRKATHDFFILEKYEAGIVLTGTEMKSVRKRRVNLKDSYAEVESGELFLVGTHISPYDKGNIWNHDPERTRKPQDAVAAAKSALAKMSPEERAAFLASLA